MGSNTVSGASLLLQQYSDAYKRGLGKDETLEVQRALVKEGFLPKSGIDGVFGPKTRAAVEAYQKAHGLKVDGIVGPQTWGSIRGEVELPVSQNINTDAFGRKPDGSPVAPSAAKGSAANIAPRPSVQVDQARTSADATALYEAMHGGLTGLGTDEDAIFKTLEGKTGPQLDAIKAHYKAHYSRDLVADLRDELSGSDLRRAELLLKGDPAAGRAEAVKVALSDKDMGELERILGPLSKTELAATRSAFERSNGPIETALNKLKGDDQTQARALVYGDRAVADAVGLHRVNSDGKKMSELLNAMPQQRRDAAKTAYQAVYKEDLLHHLNASDRARAHASATGDVATEGAYALRHAMEGLGTDEQAIFGALEGKSDADRKAITAAYGKAFGRDLVADLKDELSGKELDKALSLLANGAQSEAEKIHAAIDGLGTDETALLAALSGKTKEELDFIRADYQHRYGTNMDAAILDDVGGREAVDVQLALRGKPTSLEQAINNVAWLVDTERERKGLNRLSVAAMNLFNGDGKRLDANFAKVVDTYKAATANGRSLSQADRQKLGTLLGYSQADLKTYRASKDAAADAVGTTATVAAGVAVTVATAGMGAPAAMMLAAEAGGGVNMVSRLAIQGYDTSGTDLILDAASGAVNGAVGAVGGVVASKVASKAVTQVSTAAAKVALEKAGVQQTQRLVELTAHELAARQAATRTYGVAEGAAQGAVNGSLGSGASTAMRDGTWDGGVGDGLSKVGGSMARGAVTGAVVGAASGSLRSGMRVQAPKGSQAWTEGGLTTSFGTTDEQLAVSRALGKVAQKPVGIEVTISLPANSFAARAGLKAIPKKVMVYGAISQKEAEQAAKAIARMQQIAGGEPLKQLDEIHILDTLGKTKSGGNIAGYASTTAGKAILVQRSGLLSKEGPGTIWHEAGHNTDFSRRASYGYRTNTPVNYDETDAIPTVMGAGQSVSKYATTNVLEDFAETQRMLFKHWDDIMADPDRYLWNNGDIGKKYMEVMAEYGIKIPPPTAK